jgi:hypothetical protein
MPQYAGNLINNANVAGGLFADNEYRTTPTTRFGTRQVQRISIYTSNDIKTGYMASNSLYSQLVRALQQNVELYAVHMPDQTFFGNFAGFGPYAFQADIALDTASDVWNGTNSLIDDNDPANWYDGDYKGTVPYNINEMSLPLTAAIQRACADAGVPDSSAQVLITWTTGDTTWATDNFIINHGDGSGLQVLSVPNTPKILPSDSTGSLIDRLVAWAKTL